MKRLKKLQFCLLISVIISLMLPTAVFAQESEYTYTVTLYAGNQGVLTSDLEKLQDGIVVETSGDDIAVEQNEEKIVISGLHYNDRVSFYVQNIAELANEKYYISGIRKGGRDNSELELSSYQVKGDKDYVIAYAIRGNMVAYTVNYQDASGNALLESSTYYGNIGESPVIAYRYVDGYRPQAYNLTRRLSANEEENVFTFVYNKLVTDTPDSDTDEDIDEDTDEDIEQTTTPETPSQDTSVEDDRLLAPIRRVITIIRNNVVGDDDSSNSNANDGNARDNQNAGGAGDGAGGGNGEGNGEGAGAGEGEDLDSTLISDDDTPLSLLELSEDQVPLADMKMESERPGTEPNLLPIYTGVGILALVAMLFLFLYCGGMRKKEAIEGNNEQAEKTQ